MRGAHRRGGAGVTPGRRPWPDQPPCLRARVPLAAWLLLAVLMAADAGRVLWLDPPRYAQPPETWIATALVAVSAGLGALGGLLLIGYGVRWFGSVVAAWRPDAERTGLPQ